jgi:diguanylate cyclase (GGDEF)-like protein
LDCESRVIKTKARWQYPLIGSAVVANALLAFQGQSELTTWKLILGGVWLLAAAFLGYGFWRREQKLAALCELDAPTGLFNRRHFELCFKRNLAHSARHRQPLALLVIDVDGLKAINDRLGHRAGDAAIALVADALRKGCRAEDVAARWGGDEFVVLAPHTNAHQAEVLARRISAAVRLQAAMNSSDAQVSGQPSAPWVTVSVGYAIGHPDKASTLMAATLFAEADQAMYRRKASRAAPTAKLALLRPDPIRQLSPELERLNP